MNPSDQIKAVYAEYADLPDVTWVGPNLRAPGLFLGFDDGTFISTDATKGYVGEPQSVSPSGEAINGIAAVGPRNLAFSTRSEISFIQTDSPENHSRMIFPGGAHGVTSTESGFFIAPLGPEGLLVARPDSANPVGMKVAVGRVAGLYHYRVVALHDGHGKEALVFAHRKGGVGIGAFDGVGGNHLFYSWSLEGMDIVDVCSLAPGSLSAVAVSSAGDILWIEDATKRTKPILYKNPRVKGVIYRTLASRGHLFILTSKGLYGLMEFIDRAASCRSPRFVVANFELPLDAVDMSLVDDRHLLFVMAENKVLTGSLAELDALLHERRKTITLPGFSSGRLGETNISLEERELRTESLPYEELTSARLLAG